MWTPLTPSPYFGRLSSRLLPEEVYELAGNTGGVFELRGCSTSHMAQRYKELLAAAVEANDFTAILAPDRSFVVYVPSPLHSTV